MSEWFITRGGEQEGPMTAPEVRDLLSSGELKASETLAWKEGMSDWKKLAESGVLAEASMSGLKRPDGLAVPSSVGSHATPPAQGGSIQIDPKPAATINPYSAPATTDTAVIDYGAPLEYPGIGRLGYFLLQLGISVVAYAILFVVILGSSSSSGAGGMKGAFVGIMIAMVIAGIAGLYIGVKRVQNLGMSGWAVLWSMVPVMSIWIGWRMFACPPGYDDHKQLDTAGKVLTGLMIALFVLAIGANIVAAFTLNSSY